MTVQPQQPAAATARPGWYPHPIEAPTTLRYWDGAAWTASVAPPPAARPVVVYAPARPQHVSGLTTGQHIFFAIATVCTLGLAAPVWALAYWLGRRRIR